MRISEYGMNGIPGPVFRVGTFFSPLAILAAESEGGNH
jgi:hypothetical protein